MSCLQCGKAVVEGAYCDDCRCDNHNACKAATDTVVKNARLVLVVEALRKASKQLREADDNLMLSAIENGDVEKAAIIASAASARVNNIVALLCDKYEELLN